MSRYRLVAMVCGAVRVSMCVWCSCGGVSFVCPPPYHGGGGGYHREGVAVVDGGVCVVVVGGMVLKGGVCDTDCPVRVLVFPVAVGVPLLSFICGPR